MKATPYVFALAIAAALLTGSRCAMADRFGSGDNRFTIDFVTIDHPGNPADTILNFSLGGFVRVGSVGSVYNIGKYEISRDAVDRANAVGDLKITLDPMDMVTTGPRPDMPATGVSWNEAARFVNWLNTSRGYGPAYRFSTQPGDPEYDSNADIDVWVAGDAGFDAGNPFRNSQARYFLPNFHEWHKAAYFDPDANRGAGGYRDYPTGSDSPPAPVASGTTAGTSVFSQPLMQGPADVAFAGGLSLAGVMGLAGNVREWEETAFDLVNDDGSSDRGMRGGDWDDIRSLGRSAAARSDRVGPKYEAPNIGFRVASRYVPVTMGDFNENGVLDLPDVDDLTRQSAGMMNPPDYDLNGDQHVDVADIEVWIKELFGSWIGDANLDSQFSSSDLVNAIAAGTYEAEIDAVWSSGDFDGNGRFKSSDLVAALADGGYEQGPRPPAVAVPEPPGLVLIAGLLPLLWTRRS